MLQITKHLIKKSQSIDIIFLRLVGLSILLFYKKLQNLLFHNKGILLNI